MNFINQLHNKLSPYYLLKHPFYQEWNNGLLTNDILQLYAKEYYNHVAAFPRYISAIHSSCDYLPHRQILLANLLEEEQGEENHPELWIRFAEGLGCDRNIIVQTDMLAETKKLVEGYFTLVNKDFASGIGALYAYEHQTPAVSESKISGLEKFYQITDERSLKFFKVHIEADEWHSAECANIIEDLNENQQINVLDGAVSGAKLLWQFLDGIHSQKIIN